MNVSLSTTTPPPPLARAGTSYNTYAVTKVGWRIGYREEHTAVLSRDSDVLDGDLGIQCGARAVIAH